MLIRRLGPEYVVWDKSASIHFRRPGRGTLYAAVRAAVAAEGRVDRVYVVELADADGVAHATVEKPIYVARRE